MKYLLAILAAALLVGCNPTGSEETTIYVTFHLTKGYTGYCAIYETVGTYQAKGARLAEVDEGKTVEIKTKVGTILMADVTYYPKGLSGVSDDQVRTVIAGMQWYISN